MAEKKKHSLVPEHKKLSEKEKTELFNKHKITLNELPKILTSDPAIADLDVEEGDVIEIRRKSATAGNSIYYRGVIRG